MEDEMIRPDIYFYSKSKITNNNRWNRFSGPSVWGWYRSRWLFHDASKSFSDLGQKSRQGNDKT